MFGLMTKREHEAAMAGMQAKVDEAWTGAAYWEAAYNARGDRLQELLDQIAANARFVEVGKARLASLEKQKAKAKREVA